MWRNRAVGFYFVAFICLLLEWMLFKSQLDIEYSNAIGTALKAIGDVALILLPYWLLAPRWRWSLLLPVWLYAVWCTVNITYYRFWSELIPPAAITMGGNVNSDLMTYGMSLLRRSDLWYIILPSLSTAILVLLDPKKSKSFATRQKLTFIGSSILIGLIGQFSYFKTAHAWNDNVSSRSLTESFKDHFFGGYTGQKSLYTYNGFVYYSVRYAYDIVDLLTNSVSLTDDQKVEISGFLQKYERKSSNDNATLDSLNVVYIIVESLNADMIGKKIGDLDVMPTLDSLASAEGTVFFDNVVSQIKASSSSDGHLLLMTGLLPPDKVAYSISYGSSNTFPSLADVMPIHNKYLLLADDGVCWNEGNTLRNFGLGKPITGKNRSGYDPEVLGRDGAMFRQAADMMKNIRQPFFMTLMTISMHIPFNEGAWSMPEEFAGAEGINQREKNYATVCHYTDRYIGDFLKSLPENTIVFIAADHSQSVASGNDTTPAAAFMAINTGRTQRISRTVGQVNLFPATLDILGRNASYGGLAPSAFNPTVNGTRDSYGNIYGNPSKETIDTLDMAYRISDIIIRGDYFGNK